MKKTLLTVLTTVLLTVLFVQSGNAQVTVSGSNGCNTTYTSLTKTGGAFLALNSVSQVGYTITISITADVTTEDGTNALTGAAGMWASLTIAPSGNRIISGGVAKPLIDLSGADYVTINGVGLTGANTLTITNTSASGATIQFINDASNNTVKYCTIKGSYFSSVPASGILFFSTTTGTTGNDNNTIDHNNITHEGSNLIDCAIFSLGTSTKENSGNIISYNNIYDFLETTKASSYGIYLNDYNTQWEITGNSFYQSSATFTGGIGHYPIYITKTNFAGTGYVIKDNYIGGSGPNCSGTWLKNSGSNTDFKGIYIKSGTAAASSIQNNTIQNISYLNTGSAAWRGIYIDGGMVNVGTITGNTIGASTGNNSIILEGSSTGGGTCSGIYVAGTGTFDCQKNIIGSITTQNTSITVSNDISGIHFSSTIGTTNISNNRIGSTDVGTSNSFNATAPSGTSAQSVWGIYYNGTGQITMDGNIISKLTNGTTNTTIATRGIVSGICTYDATGAIPYIITNNIVSDLTISNANTGAGNYGSILGIMVNRNTAANTVTGNTVYNLTNSYSSFAGSIYGIYHSGIATTATVISRNFIHSLSATGVSNTASIYGLFSYGSYNASNNIISLGGNTASTLYGIYEPGSGPSNLYFNTVYIGGTPTSGALNSYALYSAGSANTRDFRNNIFYNARSNNGATGKHFAIYMAYTVNTLLTIDYNDYLATGTGGMLGYHTTGTYSAANDISTLANWKTATTQDANSLNTNPLFASAGGTTAANYVPASSALLGVTGTGITTDYAGTTRSVTAPAMGAYDYTVSGLITVTATVGTATGNYNTLKSAFDAINSGTHKGVINIMIYGSTSESASAALYQSGYNSTSSYTSVNIYPTTTGLSISGNLAAPLIDLNGADNVTIDGRVNATGSTKDLTITNTSILSTAGTSTIRFINDATSNTVKFCKIKGSTTVICNGVNSGSGIIFFSTAASVGNNSNTIDNNEITNAADVSRPLCAIFSMGSATYINTTNTISNNNIYDFLNRGVASYGIFLGDNTTAWTVSGNNFYETASFIPTATIIYNVIYIVNTGVNYSISNNYIGGAAADHSGIWTKTNAFDNIFYGIYVNAGTSTASSIQGNTINNISWSNSSSSLFCGIGVWGGKVNVGTSSGNTIGAATGTGTLTFTGGASATFYGIYLNSTSTVNASNNTVGSITTSNAATSGTNTYGIFTTSSGTFTINSNLIGSNSTVNSINASSTSSSFAQSVYGINNSGTGACTISGNIIANLTNGSTASGQLNSTCGINVTSGTTFTISNNIIHDITAVDAATSGTSVAGIVFNQTAAYAQTVSGNSIYNLKNTNASFAGSVSGLVFGGGSTASTISGNFIHDLSVTGASSTAGSIYGIKIATGVATYFNNIISLGGNTKTYIYGIYDPGTTNINTNLYFNTVYISGTLASGTTAQSYALKCNSNTSNRNYRNNIFVNTRSTSGGSNLHAAIGFMATGGTLTCDYNDYIASGTGGFLGYYSWYVTTLPIVTGQDANSLNTNPSFTNAGGTTPGSYQAGASLTGVTGTLITTDYFNRSRTGPQMGAFESGVYNYTWTGTTNTNWNTTTNWVGGYVPSTGDNVVIQTGASNMPVTGSDVTYNTLEVQSGTTVTLGSNISLSGTLTLSGLLVLGNYNLTLGSSSVITGTPSATNMVVATGTGELRKTFTGTGSFTFPVGDNTGTAEYSPVTLNFTSGTFASAYVGVNLSNTKYGSNSSLSHYLNRYWTVTPSGISSFSCNVTLQYVPADVVGTEANIWAGKYSSGTWTGLNQTDAVNHRLTGTVSGFSTFTGGENGAMPVTLSSFTSSVSSRDVKLNWVTASEVNNAGFFIEKSEIRNQNSEWKNVGFVAGKGTTNEQTVYNFEDKKLATGKYQYRLKQVDNNGNFEYHNLNGVVEVGLPTKYEISQNYPNPFNPTTKIDFQLPTDGKVSLKIYDITGREMATLVNNEFKKADYYTVMFNGSNLSSGVYFYRITADKYVMTKKMVLLK